jgi:6-phosphogluconolactonase
LQSRGPKALKTDKNALILVSLALFSACGGPSQTPVARARFVYALAEPEYLGEDRFANSLIAGFRVDPASGALTPLVDSPFDLGAPGETFTVHPSGGYLYLLSYGSIVGVAIDPSAGRLLGAVPGSPSVTDAGRLIVSPDGQSLYGVDEILGLWGYHVDASTGALTPLPGSPFGPLHPQQYLPGTTRQVSDVVFADMVLIPSGRALYGLGDMGLGQGYDVWAYRVNPSTGVLDNLRHLWKMDPPAESMAIEPSGRFLYLGSRTYLAGSLLPARIDAFAIDPATGNLSTLPGSPFSQDPMKTNTALIQLIADPTGQFLFASAGPTTPIGTEDVSDIWAYAIDRVRGTLLPVPGSPFPIGQGVRNAGRAGLAFDPGGKRLYAAGCDKVHILDVDDSGRLTPIAGSPVLLPFCSHELGVAP